MQVPVARGELFKTQHAPFPSTVKGEKNNPSTLPSAMSIRPILVLSVFGVALGIAVYVGVVAGGRPAKPKAPAPTVAKSTAPAPKIATPAPRLALPTPQPTVPPLPPAGAPPPSLPDPLQEEAEQKEINDLLAALKKLDQQPDSPEARAERQRLVARFAELDPMMALGYVDTLTGEEYIAQKANALGTWAASDPAAAGTWFSEYLVSALAAEGNSGAAAAIAQAWAEKDPQAALGWVTSLPEEARAQAVNVVIGKIASQDPQAALQTVAALTSEAERAAALGPVAEQWAQSAGAQAAAWVSGLKDETAQAHAAAGLIKGWVDKYPRAASQWMKGLQPGKTRDAAVTALTQSQAAQKDPGAALGWAASIQDVELRNQILPKLLKDWQEKDPAALQKFLSKQK